MGHYLCAIQYMIFKEIDSSGGDEYKIFYKNILLIKKNNDSFYVEISKNRSSQKLVIHDIVLYKTIIEKWKVNKDSIFLKIEIFIENLHLSKKILLLTAVIPIAVFIIYIVLYQSYKIVPVSFDKKIGIVVFEKYISQYNLCSNTRLKFFLNEVAVKLKPVNSPYEYKIFIVENDIPNAFALPDGHIILFSGLIEKSDSPEEVAGVIAHEISHVERRHAMQRLVRFLGLAVFIKAIVGAGLEEAEFAEFFSEIVDILIYLKYSQDFEREADLDAVNYLHASNMSAKGLVSFFKKLDKIEKAPEHLSWLSTHPDNLERISYLEKKIGNAKIMKSPLNRFRSRWDIIKKCQ